MAMASSRMAMRYISRRGFKNSTNQASQNIIRESIQNIRMKIRKKAGFLGGITGVAVTALAVTFHIKVRELEDWK